MIGKLFVYDNVRVSEDRKILNFDYRVETDEQTFSLTEKIELPYSLPNSSTVDRLLRALHLALGISYYKTFMPPAIDHDYEISGEEASFWNDVFKNGLGEFLYKNELDPGLIARFKTQNGSIRPGTQDDIEWHDTAFLGIGGGKDSIVAGELLKELNIPTKGFVLATASNRGQTQEVVSKMGVNLLTVKRWLDPQMLEMNKIEGAHNGHVPISLIFALIGCLLATIAGDKYVIVANESSASIPHTQWQGQDINHQWSKSLEFEELFQSYVHNFVSSELEYFSIIRPLSSVAVAKIFANYPNYFETFTSDNSLFKIEQSERKHPRWSHDSPKSLSSYILLAPWMSNEDLDRTFGSNILDQPDLEPLFLGLLGEKEEPILDCVGTPEELKLSLSLLLKQNRMNDSALMQIARNLQITLDSSDVALTKSLEINTNHAIPDQLSNKVLTILEEKLA